MIRTLYINILLWETRDLTMSVVLHPFVHTLNFLTYTTIGLLLYPSIYGSTDLCWALVAFQFLNPIHSR
jgi:hypothetical protein